MVAGIIVLLFILGLFLSMLSSSPRTEDLDETPASELRYSGR